MFVHKSKRRIWLVTLGIIMMVVGIWLMLVTVQAVAQRELSCERVAAENNCLLRLKWLGVLLNENKVDIQDVVLENVDNRYQLFLVTENSKRPFSVPLSASDQLQAQVNF